VPKILLAIQHLIVCQSLKRVLQRGGFEVVGEASDGRQALKMAKQLHPDIAILDCSLPVLNGVEAALEIRQSSSGTKVILLTTRTEDRYIRAALKGGVTGCVLKSESADNLLEAVREVGSGNIYLSRGISRDVLSVLERGDPVEEVLSSRERQVLQPLAEGMSTKEVAALLGIGVKTAESHRARIMQKLGIHDIAGLVRYAIREGLIQP
jgi:two-component system, NarL family, response regulator NreC